MAHRALLDDYLAGVELLREAVTGLTREQARARPIPGKWSTLEVVCHLADFEPIYADRIKRVLSFDRPLLLAADEAGFARKLAYHDRDLNEEVELIVLTRRQLAAILRAADDADWQRSGVHSENGLVTVEQLLSQAVRHIRHHVPFIEEKRRALGLGAAAKGG